MELQIGDQLIGEEHPSYIIAEAGINHNGSVQIAKNLVDMACEAGADAVKFQKRKLKKTYVEDIIDNPAIAERGTEHTVNNLKDVELTDDQFRRIADYCNKKDIQFLCTPFDKNSVEFLEDVGVPAYKIGSSDMTNFVLLEHVAKTGKPLLVSTGMSEESEISNTVDFLKELGVDFALLHCRSTYPSPYHNLNLAFIQELQDKYNVISGYSGHERGIAVSSAAVALGADIVERHITLSRDMEGPDHAASLEETGIKKLVRDIRNIEKSIGTPNRYITQAEYVNRRTLGKSLTTSQNILAGEKIQREDLTAKSPGTGISPQKLYEIVGKTTSKDVPEDTILQWDMLENVKTKEYNIDLDNWGVVVRFSDINTHSWGDPDVFEFRINDQDLTQSFDIQSSNKVLSAHAPDKMYHEHVNLSSLDEDKRKKSVETIQKTIDLVRQEIKPSFSTDSPHIIVHPGGITKHERAPSDIPAMNDSLSQSIAELNTDGVSLLLENMPPISWLFGGQEYCNNFMNAEEIANFCEKNNVKICYDTSHAKLYCNFAEKDFYEHAKTLKPYTEYLHVADARGIDGEGIQIGDGEIDFQRFFEIHDDFEGPIITEIWRGHEQQGQGFKIAAERLSDCL